MAKSNYASQDDGVFSNLWGLFNDSLVSTRNATKGAAIASRTLVDLGEKVHKETRLDAIEANRKIDARIKDLKLTSKEKDAWDIEV